jgi:hypothetical protein
MLARLKYSLLPRLLTKATPLYLLGAILAAAVVYASVESANIGRRSAELADSALKAEQLLADVSFQEHLAALERKKFEESLKLTGAISQEEKDRLSKMDQILGLYKDVGSKVARNDAAKLNSADITDQYADWGKKFLAQELDPLIELMTTAVKTLDQRYSATTVAAAPKPAVVNPEGYSYKTISTSRGNFGVYSIKLPLSQYTVKTVSANSSNCTNNCPTKTLAQYVSENGAYAGMNGTYFCPPDYSGCAGKTNSYDYPLYNSNISTWLNQVALSWTSIGLATFNGKTPKFYRYTNQFPGGSVTAGIGNFPTLLEGGSVVVNEGELTSAQKLKGTRGSIGVDGTYVYLSLVASATVTDSAYALQAIGVQNALNLDGGGSSALYIGGSYKVGPGRLLPNVIVLIK